MINNALTRVRVRSQRLRDVDCVHARGGYTRAWNNAAQREKQKIPAGTGGVAAGKRFMQKTNWSRSLTPSSFRESSLWQLQSDILCGRVPIRPVLK